MRSVCRRLCAMLLVSIVLPGAARIFAPPRPTRVYTVQDIWPEQVKCLTVQIFNDYPHVYTDPALIEEVYGLLDGMTFVEDTRAPCPLPSILHVVWEGDRYFKPNYGPANDSIHLAFNWDERVFDIGLPIGEMESGTAYMRFGKDDGAPGSAIDLVPAGGDTAALIEALSALKDANEDKNIYHET